MWIVSHACIAAATPPPSSPQDESTAVSPNDSPDQKGVTEWGWNSGGAAGIAGGASKSSFWTLNLRWGRVLTSPHVPGPLRGSLEYAVEVAPAFVVRQSSTVFGGGVTPLVLQYNFVHSRRVVPFIQIAAGTLFTAQQVPENTSQVNFTPQGGIGFYWFQRQRSALTLGVRYHHISNAGLTKPNPGHNGLYIYAGMSWWR
jgi:lipid A 3-O-deacylase